MTGKIFGSLSLALVSILVLGGFFGVWTKPALQYWAVIWMWVSGVLFGSWLEELLQRHSKKRSSRAY